MKKLLSIIVLGLLWFIPVSADHDDTKAWEVDGEYLTPKCFLYEWFSSGNFKEFYKKYATEKTRYGSPEWKKWWNNIGLYYGKEIPLEDSFKTSGGDYTLSLTRYLKDCTSSKPIIEDEEKFLSYEVPTNLKVWKDFLNPFEELRKKVLCISFTLLSNRLVFLNSKVNKINWDLILSCETLEVYKPNINAYLKTAKMLQLKPEECVMVACHSFDLNAAKEAGFNTIFVKRAQEWGSNTKISIDGNYDMVIENFNELEEITK